MNTLEVSEKNLVVNVPADWDEMSPEQLKYVLKQAVLLNAGRITKDEFKLRSFYKLANIHRDKRTILWEKLAPKHLVEEKNANAWMLSQRYCKFLLRYTDKEKTQEEINFDSVVNHFPVLNLDKEYYGPENILSDLTFGEFRAAIDFMNVYFAEKDLNSLNQMITCLYRPGSGNPEDNGVRLREPFNKHKIERLAKPLRKLEHWQRLGILLWFTWCIKYLQTGDLIINGRLINLSPLFPEGKKEKSGNKSSAAGLGWTGVLFRLAKDGVFGDIEKTDQADFFDVLLYMYDNHLENKRLKSKNK